MSKSTCCTSRRRICHGHEPCMHVLGLSTFCRCNTIVKPHSASLPHTSTPKCSVQQQNGWRRVIRPVPNVCSLVDCTTSKLLPVPTSPYRRLQPDEASQLSRHECVCGLSRHIRDLFHSQGREGVPWRRHSNEPGIPHYGCHSRRLLLLCFAMISPEEWRPCPQVTWPSPKLARSTSSLCHSRHPPVHSPA